MLYPFLVVHFREKILCQEGRLSLSRKYQEGNAALSKELEKSGLQVEQFEDNIEEELKSELSTTENPSLHTFLTLHHIIRYTLQKNILISIKANMI